MKILISSDSPHAHYFERLGLARAFSTLSHDVLMWDIRNKPAHDMFNEFEPDIFIGQTYNVDRALFKCIASRPALRVVMKAGDWGYISNTWSQETKSQYPILFASEKEKQTILRMKDECGKPDFLFIHYHPDWINQTHNKWTEAGIPVISLMNAADVFDYTGGRFVDDYSSDIAFVGGYWPYKARTLDKYILPLCNPKLDLKIRIFGNQGWNIPQYCGFAPESEVKHIFRSAAICPNVSEPHSQVFGFDIIERPFKLLSNKCFVISDYVEGLDKILGDGLVLAKTPQEFIAKIFYYLENPHEKMEIVERGYKKVIDSHTYFDRAATIMDNLGYSFDAQMIRINKKDVIKRLGL